MDRSVFLVQILAHVADINAKLAGVKGHLGKVTGETLGCIRSPIYIAQQTIQEIEQLIGEIGTLATVKRRVGGRCRPRPACAESGSRERNGRRTAFLAHEVKLDFFTGSFTAQVIIECIRVFLHHDLKCSGFSHSFFAIFTYQFLVGLRFRDWNVHFPLPHYWISDQIPDELFPFHAL